MIETTITDDQLARASELLDSLIKDYFRKDITPEEKEASGRALEAAENLLAALGFDYSAGPNLELVIHRGDGMDGR